MRSASFFAFVILGCCAFGPAKMVAQTPLVTVDTVLIGDAGNAPVDSWSRRGSVEYAFRIGKFEVTVEQYATFLNSVASVTSSAHIIDLWKTWMDRPSFGGIRRSGSGTPTEPYRYEVTGNGNIPIDHINWFDAARFCNWLHNGATNGASTENGAYPLNGSTDPSVIITKEANASWWIPSLDEWWKAAYYKGGGTNAGFWKYPTQSDERPGNSNTTDTNQANYRRDNIFFVTQVEDFSQEQDYRTTVGTFSNSPSFYGTHDQGGNVLEWNDATWDGLVTALVGGYYINYEDELAGASAGTWDRSRYWAGWGFRVARNALQGTDDADDEASPNSAPHIFGQSMYIAVGASSWFEAQQLALELGGNLVTINSAEENDFLVQHFSHHTQAYIGFTNDGVSGQWRWVDGSESSYTNWNNDDSLGWSEPNNSGGDETVVAIKLGGPDRRFVGLWHDIPVSGTDVGIVEIPVKQRNDSIYAIVPGPKWEDAQAQAQRLGGSLVTIEDAEENAFLVETFAGKSGEVQGLWIGLSDVVAEGKWTWSSGFDFTYRNWVYYEPNGGTNENFVHLWSANPWGYPIGTWNDIDSPPGRGQTDPSGQIKQFKGIAEIYPNFTVVDSEAPVIKLIGDAPMEVVRGSEFIDPGARVIDNVDYERTIVGTGTVDTFQIGAYTLTYTASDAAGNAAVEVTRMVNVIAVPNPGLLDSDGDGVNDYREVQDGTDPEDPQSFNVLSRGLVVHYPFKNSFTDASGLNNDLVNRSEGITLTNGRFGETKGALLIQDRASASSANNLEISGNQNNTIAFWYRSYPAGPDVTRYASMVVGVGAFGSNEGGRRWCIIDEQPRGALGVGFWGNWADGGISLEGKGELFHDEWHHIAYVHEGTITGTKIYVNGTLQSGGGYATRTDVLDIHPSPLLVGEWVWWERATRPERSISDLRIYNRALSSDEVEQLYIADAAGLDSDGDGITDAAELLLEAMGFDPKVRNDAVQVLSLFSNPNNAALFTQSQRDSFGELQFSNGESSVINNRSAFNLFTQQEFDSNRTLGQSDVISNPMSYGLYTKDSIMDFRMGGLMIQKQGAGATIVFQSQTTTDLATEPFTNNGTPITNNILMPEDKAFIRINAKPEQSVP